MEAVLAGEDVLAIMPTGAGKSLCYQLPAMLLDGCTVVISPLVALMKDQVESLPPNVRARAFAFNSTVERDELNAAANRLAAGDLKLVYVAPERLRRRDFLHALARARISRFVVDEAHCVSLWGHDFRPDYFAIPAVLTMLGRPPLLAMTATATPALQQELKERFGRPLRLVHTGVVRDNLALSVEQHANADAKLGRLLDICTTTDGAGIVYVGSRRNAEEVAGVLRRNGVKARHYHAGLDSGERGAVQDAFMRGYIRVIVATVAFGMGVDKQDVRFIVHYQPSRSLEAYAQESGRAGRDGEPARCILLWSTADRSALSRYARDDALQPTLLQAVYRVVRRISQSGGRFAWLTTEALISEVRTLLANRDIDDTAVRVALGALEQVGVLRRHCDAPWSIRVTSPAPALGLEDNRLLDSDTGLSGGFEQAGGFDDEWSGGWDGDDGMGGDFSGPIGGGLSGKLSGPGQVGFPGMDRPAAFAPRQLTLFDAATRLGVTPEMVEPALLDEQAEGRGTFSFLRRAILVEVLPHPSDLGGRLRGLIDAHAQAQLQRSEDMQAYMTGRVCRMLMIAGHFGVNAPGRCGECDICLSGPPRPSRYRSSSAAPAAPPPLPDRAPEDIILDAVADLPFAMGRRNLARILHGAISSKINADESRYHGALAALSIKAIEDEIDALLETRYLAREGGEYPVIVRTAAGRDKDPSPWPPVRPTGRLAAAFTAAKRAEVGVSQGGPKPSPLTARSEAGTGSPQRGTRDIHDASAEAFAAALPEPAGPLGGARGRVARSKPADSGALPPTGPSQLPAGDPRIEARFQRLRDWRREQVRGTTLPPYTVFSDATLRLLAQALITSIDDLTQVKGIGPAKLERYGEEVVGVLQNEA